ncbi:MAG: hypothetical protein ACFFCM_18655 [Promethearchaeota archaeon]
MVSVKINKKEIQDGIKEGFYTKLFKHNNPFPDTEDPSDKSYEEHTVLLYINENYNVAGVKSFFGDSPPLHGDLRIPIRLQDKIEMKINLSALTHNDFIVLKVCDGFNTIEQIAEITQIPLENLEKMVETLKKKRFLQVIRTS